MNSEAIDKLFTQIQGNFDDFIEGSNKILSKIGGETINLVDVITNLDKDDVEKIAFVFAAAGAMGVVGGLGLHEAGSIHDLTIGVGHLKAHIKDIESQMTTIKLHDGELGVFKAFLTDKIAGAAPLSFALKSLMVTLVSGSVGIANELTTDNHEDHKKDNAFEGLTHQPPDFMSAKEKLDGIMNTGIKFNEKRYEAFQSAHPNIKKINEKKFSAEFKL